MRRRKSQQKISVDRDCTGRKLNSPEFWKGWKLNRKDRRWNWRIAMITKHLKEPTYTFTIYFCWYDALLGLECYSEPVCCWPKLEILFVVISLSLSNWWCFEVFKKVGSFKTKNKCRTLCCLIFFNACHCLSSHCHVNKIITHGKLYQ